MRVAGKAEGGADDSGLIDYCAPGGGSPGERRVGILLGSRVPFQHLHGLRRAHRPAKECITAGSPDQSADLPPPFRARAGPAEGSITCRRGGYAGLQTPAAAASGVRARQDVELLSPGAVAGDSPVLGSFFSSFFFNFSSFFFFFARSFCRFSYW